MATEAANTGGVKSLRAKFENAHAPHEPESRGRTPGSSNNGEASRPLSTVRSAFVAVEPTTAQQQLLSKKMSSASLSTRNVSSGSSSSESGPTAQSGTTVSSDAAAALEGASHPAGSFPEGKEFATAPLGNGLSPARTRRKAQPTSHPDTSPPADVLKNLATTLHTPSKSNLPAAAAGPIDSISNNPSPPAPTSASAPANPPKAPVVANGKLTASQPKSNPKPAPTSVEKTRPTPNPPSSTRAPITKPQTTPRLPASKSSTTQLRAMTQSSTNGTPPSFARQTSSNTSKINPHKAQQPQKQAKPKTEGTRSSTGFVKPRPRSPTRPVNLPAHLVASTASSAAKLRSEVSAAPSREPSKHIVEGTRSATGFVKPRPKSPTRPINLPSHLVAPTASSAAKLRSEASAEHPTEPSAARSRRTSNISTASSRQSSSHVYQAPARKPSATFGPPPKKKAQDANEVHRKASKPPDEGFLARMMRPTASSASKLLGKPEDGSPSRTRVASRLGVRGQESSKPRPISMSKTGHGTQEAQKARSNKTHQEKPKVVEEQPAQTSDYGAEHLPEQRVGVVKTPEPAFKASTQSSIETIIPETLEDISESAATLVSESADENTDDAINKAKSTPSKQTAANEEPEASPGAVSS